MRDVADLRQAMARDTADLAPRASAEDILRGGRRRIRRRAVAATAGAALVAMVLPAAILSTGDERGDTTASASPSATPTTTPRPTGVAPAVGCPADPKAAKAIGETIWTGATTSNGMEIVVRLVQNDRADTETAGFGVGLGDPATGTVERLTCSFGFPLPPDPANYPRRSAEFDGPDFSGPDRTTTIVDSFVGAAARITATYDGAPLTVGFQRWSTHPELVVYWVTGVPAGADVNPRDEAHPLVSIYDSAGDVIGPPK